MRLFYWIFIPFAIVALLLIVLPLTGMFARTTLGEFFQLFTDGEVIASIILTFETALYATLFAIIFGTPLAYMLARFTFPGKRLIEAIIDIPIMVPHTAAGIALLVVFGTGAIAELFKSFGIDFIGTRAGIALGMAFVSIPFYIDSVKDGFSAIDPKLDNVARSLGASRLQVFSKVMLPIAARSIVTGSILMWGRGISEFGAVVILAYHPMIAPVLIYERFTSFGLKTSRPVAVMLITLCIIVFTLLKIISSYGISRHDKASKH